jgi:NAD-dependent SIR2 family protein deacetylase
VSWFLREGQAERRQIALISTNYDIAIEHLLFRAYKLKYSEIPQKFDFGMTWRAPLDMQVHRPRNPELRVYKLHGSLNWLRCDLCEHVYVNLRGLIAHLAFRKKVNPANTCDCGHRLRAALVAPSFVRDIRDVNLLEVWKAAFDYLRRADQWIVIGYSFPPEDIAIHSLFLRAHQGRPTKRNGEKRPPPAIRVIQDKEDAKTTARYKLFFPNCTFEYGGTEAFIDALPP